MAVGNGCSPCTAAGNRVPPNGLWVTGAPLAHPRVTGAPPAWTVGSRCSPRTTLRLRDTRPSHRPRLEPVTCHLSPAAAPPAGHMSAVGPGRDPWGSATWLQLRGKRMHDRRPEASGDRPALREQGRGGRSPRTPGKRAAGCAYVPRGQHSRAIQRVKETKRKKPLRVKQQTLPAW